MSEFIFVIVFALALSPLYIPMIVTSVGVVKAVHWWLESLEDADSAANRLRAALAERRAHSLLNFSRPAAQPA